MIADRRSRGGTHFARSSAAGTRDGGWSPSRLWLAYRLDLLVVGVYLAVAVLGYIHLWTAPGPVTVAGAENDPAQTMWFLAQAPYAVLHGQNPLVDMLGNAPYGVNLMDNSSIVAPALLLSPVTIIFGPATSYVVLVTLALASSAAAAYFLLRRLTAWRPAAFAGGLLYGFSPYMIGQGAVHAHMIIALAPPLMALVVHQVLARDTVRPEVLGLAMAALAVWQWFSSNEILATSLVMIAVGVVLAALSNWSAAVSRAGRALRFAVVSAVASTLALAYPIWVYLAGPDHLHGVIQWRAQKYRADLLAMVVPSRLEAIAPRSALQISNHFVDGGLGENGVYLGIPLLLCAVAAGVLLWRRRPVARVFAGLLVVSLVLSLGARLALKGVPSLAARRGFPLPEAVFRHLGPLASIQPSRLGLYSALFAGVLMALAMDALWVAGRDRFRSRALRTVPAFAVAIACLVPVVPAWPYATMGLEEPAYFASADVRSVPEGSTALLYPYPERFVYDNAMMLWQADARMRFNITGGYLYVPDANGSNVLGRSSKVRAILDQVFAGHPMPAMTPSLRARLTAELTADHVTVVLADTEGAAGRRGVEFLQWLVGRPPAVSGGVAAWYGVRWKA